MEALGHGSLTGPQEPSPMDCGPPGALGGILPDTWVEPLDNPTVSSFPACQESPALSSAPSTLDLLVQDIPGSTVNHTTVQEKKTDQSQVKKPKTRTTFSQEQLKVLKDIFAVSRYLTPEKGQNLAEQLGLSYKQVKTWFQNQRLKSKKSQTEVLRTTYNCDHHLPQLGSAGGPQSLSLPSFHVDPRVNHPARYSGLSNQVSEDWQQNYGGTPYPYQMACRSSFSPSALQATLGYPGPSSPQGSQTNVVSYALPTPMLGLGSNGSEAITAPKLPPVEVQMAAVLPGSSLST